MAQTTGKQNYSTQDWHQSNQYQYQAAETELMRAERTRDEHERLRRDRQELKERTQADVSVKIGQRINDVNYWHEEISRRQVEVQQRITQAVELLERLNSALRDTALPKETNERCLANRERRPGIELVHDCVQVELTKEKDTIEGAAAMLKRTIEQVKEQLRLLRKSAYNLSKDLSDKNMALSIDGDCLRRNEGTVGPYTLPNQPMLESKTVAQDQWEDFSDVNIVTAEQQCHTFDKLSGVAADVLNQCCHDILHSRMETNRAFEKRIAETQEAKQQLEHRREKVVEERQAVENDIAELLQAIQAKIPALQLSQYRTAQRGERPNIELVRDPVHHRLLAEAAELDESIKQLQEAHAKAVHHYELLCSRHVALTEDIDRKAITLQIDQNECVALRAQLVDLWTNQ